MPEIKNKTLCIAIQAVAAEIRKLREYVAREDSEPEDEQMLEDFIMAAEDLESAYDIQAETVVNLPPYDALVGDGEG